MHLIDGRIISPLFHCSVLNSSPVNHTEDTKRSCHDGEQCKLKTKVPLCLVFLLFGMSYQVINLWISFSERLYVHSPAIWNLQKKGYWKNLIKKAYNVWNFYWWKLNCEEYDDIAYQRPKGEGNTGKTPWFNWSHA